LASERLYEAQVHAGFPIEVIVFTNLRILRISAIVTGRFGIVTAAA
jgi:hypothetical protein